MNLTNLCKKKKSKLYSEKTIGRETTLSLEQDNVHVARQINSKPLH